MPLNGILYLFILHKHIQIGSKRLLILLKNTNSNIHNESVKGNKIRQSNISKTFKTFGFLLDEKLDEKPVLKIEL